MSKVGEYRRANIKALIEERGGLTRLSKAMGYKNPSFLSQMTGPNPTREITEKVARRIEEVLRLPNGSLDKPIGYAQPSPDPTATLVADVIRVVGLACETEGVNLGPLKFSEIVALAYADSVERGEPRADRVKQLVRLLK